MAEVRAEEEESVRTTKERATEEPAVEEADEEGGEEDEEGGEEMEAARQYLDQRRRLRGSQEQRPNQGLTQQHLDNQSQETAGGTQRLLQAAKSGCRILLCIVYFLQGHGRASSNPPEV